MSISSGNIGLINIAINYLGGRFAGLNVLELGNQKILAMGNNGKEYKKCTAKQWFKNMGAKHTSFDLNGLDGALPIDLCVPVDEEYVDKFDLLTNYGTTEHVEKQKEVFQNIHNLLREGGVMVHSIPLEGYWKGHCPYHYTEKFPEGLCKVNGYHLLHKRIQDRNKNKLLNFVIAKDTNKEFVGLPVGEITASNNYKKNTDNLF